MGYYDFNQDENNKGKIYMNVVTEEEKENQQQPFGPEPEPKECFYNETVKTKKKKNRNYIKKIIAACVVAGVAGGSIGAGYSVTQNLMFAKNQSDTVTANGATSSNTSYVQTSSTQTGGSAVEIIKAVTPSVVSISTKVQGKASYFGGFVVPYEGQGAGSGVIFYQDDERIAIATNNHVVGDATEIQVTFNEDTTVPAKVVGTDASTDLAVISVSKEDLTAAGIDSVKVATFGDSDKVEVGESVIAIGNALGEGKTATSGMVSATGKELDVDGQTMKVIQTDAAINPGNSGGALVNSKGEVIGINTIKIAEEAVEGMGYAIPSNVISPIIETLLTDGSIPKPYLGIVGSDITSDVSQLYQLPVGVLVREVVVGGSADKAGIQQGDIIIEFAGQKVMSMDKLVDILAEQKVGDKVSARIIRDGQTAKDVTVTILDANQA